MTTRRGDRLLAAGLALVLLAPLVPVALWSASRGWFFPRLLPPWSLDAWSRVLDPSSGIPGALLASLSIAAVAAAAATAIALPAARALADPALPGRTGLILLLLAPAVVPGLAVAMGLHALFLKLGLTGSIAGVVLVHLVPCLPYALLVLIGVFADHDPGFEAVARSLGASPAKAFTAVTLPMLAPGVAVAFAFTFLVSWSQYTPTLLIGSGRVVTLPLILAQFVGAGRNDLAGAVAVLTVVPGVAVLALASGPLSRLRPRRIRAGAR